MDQPRSATPEPNIYLSPKIARFLVLAIEGYCKMLEQANKHQGEDCQYFIDNDISMYQSVSQAIGKLHP